MVVLGTPNGWVPVLLLLAAAPTAWLGLASWQRRRVPGATPLALTALAAAVWCLLAALQFSSQNPGVQVILANLEYVSQAFLPVLWLLVVLEFTGRESGLRRGLPWLFVVPAVTVALAITYRWHGLLLPAGASGSYGPWHWVQSTYSYLVLAASFAWLALAWLAAAPPQRGQVSMLLASMLVPLAWIGLAVFQPAAGLALTVQPVGLAFSALIVVWGLLSFRLFDVAPLAQAAVFAGLPDAVVVLDLGRCVADFNPAAARLFGWQGRDARGQPASLALAAWPEVAGAFSAALRGEPAPSDLVSSPGPDPRLFELSLAPLADPHGRTVGQVLTLRDATEHRRIEDELARLATTDNLTGLADRRHLYEALTDEVGRARRYEAPLALLFLDVDRFKALNDQHGRQAGDEALRAVARALRRLARQSDLPARLGADEFVLILPHTNLLGAETVAGRLVAAASQIQISAAQAASAATAGELPEGQRTERLPLSLSVGAVELAPNDDEQGEALLARADKALRAAKEAGGGRVMVEETEHA